MNTPRMLKRMMERFDDWGSIIEKLTTALLALLAGNCLVLFFLVEGYEFNLGPFQIHAYSLHKWMLVFWVVALMKIAIVAWRTRQPLGQLLRTPLLLFLAVGSIYLANESAFWSGDTESTRYLPYSIIRELDFDLDEFPVFHEPGALFKFPGANVDEVPESQRFQRRYSVTLRGGHLVGTYPPWTAVLAVPVYLPTVLRGEAANYKVVDALEKRAAALIAVLAVAVFYVTVRRLSTEKIAWAVTLIYALGTSTFSTSSQALWQHGPAQLFLTLVAYCLLRAAEKPQFVMYAGLAMGSAILCRPLDVVVAVPILGFVFHKHRAHFLNFLLGGIPPFILFISYNYAYFDNPVMTGFSAKVISPTESCCRKSMYARHAATVQA
jgi:4-amino-4-deoxy-L-arabinose transferase-like glycosyltransferase